MKVNQQSSKEYIHMFYKKNKLKYIISVIVVIIFSFMQIFTAKIMQVLTDVAVSQDYKKLGEFIQLSLLFIVILTAIQFTSIHTKLPFLKQAMHQYKTKIFTKIIEKDISCFSNEQTGSYISILTNDVNTIEQNYLLTNFDIVKNLVLLIGALVMMFYYDWPLTIFVIFASSVSLVLPSIISKSVSAKENIVGIRNEKTVSLIKDLLLGFTVIKTFNAEEQIKKLYEEDDLLLETAKYDRRKASSIINIIANILSFLTEISVFIFGSWRCINGEISVGIMIAFVQLMNYIIEPINAMPTLIANKKSSLVHLDKFINLMSKSEVNDGNLDISGLSNGICFNNVAFSHYDKKIFSSINIEFQKGKSYAIVGSSGCGKTTLLNLLLGYYKDYTGTITIDDIDLKDIKKKSLFKTMSVIQQNVIIFNSSIINNITMFNDIEKARIDNALEKSGLTSVVNEKGIDYTCGENGINLSGGEKQRIAIARSLIKESSVLLIDEATSALDKETATKIENTILDLHGITRIVVTHRLNPETLQKYNYILVLDNGIIVENGNFDELMNKRGDFFKIYNGIRNNEDE
nr:ABC transporter ATP-binding protein [uncultured Anaerosporobacter sp.]